MTPPVIRSDLTTFPPHTCVFTIYATIHRPALPVPSTDRPQPRPPTSSSVAAPNVPWPPTATTSTTTTLRYVALRCVALRCAWFLLPYTPHIIITAIHHYNTHRVIIHIGTASVAFIFGFFFFFPHYTMS